MDTIKKRQEEATSNETLEDLEEVTTETEPSDTDGPSPDGAFDQDDERENADPV